MDIEAEKVDIQELLEIKYPMISKKMCSYAAELYAVYGTEMIFGRTMVEKVFV